MHRHGHSLAAAALVVAACSGEAAQQPAEQRPDSLARTRCPIADACVPCGAQGNELHVGEYCTKGGGECDDNGIGKNAVLCAIDFRDDAPPFCTRACRFNSDCGSGAVCTGDPKDSKVPTACVPVACAAGSAGIEPDAGTGVDGGAPPDGG